MKKMISLLFPLAMVICLNATAQERYNLAKSNVVVNGTSTVHDWDMKSDKGIGFATLNKGANGQLASIANIQYVVAIKDLKSSHDGMDKNAQKALKADKNPTITFTAAQANLSTKDGINYTITTKGKLAMAGASKDVDLSATGKLNADQSFTVNGKINLDMKAWGVVPPSFMFGAMKTGKDVVLSYIAVYHK